MTADILKQDPNTPMVKKNANLQYNITLLPSVNTLIARGMLWFNMTVQNMYTFLG